MTVLDAVRVHTDNVKSAAPVGESADLVDVVSTPVDPERAQRFKAVFNTMTVIGLVVVVVLIVLGLASGVLTSVASLREFVAGFGLFAPIAFIVAGALEAVFPVIPGSGAIIAAPIIFGHIEGTVYAYLATVVGSILVFAISRLVGRDLVVARFSERTVTRYGRWLQHPKFTKYFAIAIALPLAPDDVLCYLAGLTGMRWRTYLLILVLCKPWGVLLYTTGVMAIVKAVFPWLGL